MIDKETIEKLQDQEQAQAYGTLLKYYPDQARIIAQAYPDNCLFLNGDNKYDQPPTGNKPPHLCTVYILKPGYEPKPEYKEWAIRKNDYGTLAAFNMSGGAERSLARCVCDLTFVGFYFYMIVTGFNNSDVSIRLEQVATAIREGHKVVARFEVNP